MSFFLGLNDNIPIEAQYYSAVVAQCIIGISNPMAFCLPTKVMCKLIDGLFSLYIDKLICNRLLKIGFQNEKLLWPQPSSPFLSSLEPLWVWESHLY